MAESKFKVPDGTVMAEIVLRKRGRRWTPSLFVLTDDGAIYTGKTPESCTKTETESVTKQWDKDGIAVRVLEGDEQSALVQLYKQLNRGDEDCWRASITGMQALALVIRHAMKQNCRIEIDSSPSGTSDRLADVRIYGLLPGSDPFKQELEKLKQECTST